MSDQHRTPTEKNIKHIATFQKFVWAIFTLFAIAGALALYLGYINFADTVPTHYSGSGEPDGWSSKTSVLTTMWIFYGAGILISLGSIGWARSKFTQAKQEFSQHGELKTSPRRVGIAPTLTQSAFAIIVAVELAIAAAVSTSSDPVNAELGSWFLLIVGEILIDLITLTLFALLPAVQKSVKKVVIEEFSPTESVAWIGQCQSKILVWTTVVLAVILVVVTVSMAVPDHDSLVTTIIMAIITILSVGLCASLAAIVVTINTERVTVRGRLIPIRWANIPLRNIKKVTYEEADAASWGGWGYRFSGEGTAIMLRSGPAIIVHRTGGALAISVDNAYEGASVLAGLLERAKTQQ